MSSLIIPGLKLILEMRHGHKGEDGQMTPEGHWQVKLMLWYLQVALGQCPQFIACSPRGRTRECGDLARGVFGNDYEIIPELDQFQYFAQSTLQGDMDAYWVEVAEIKAAGNTMAQSLEISDFVRRCRQANLQILQAKADKIELGQAGIICGHSPMIPSAVLEAKADQVPQEIDDAAVICYYFDQDNNLVDTQMITLDDIAVVACIRHGNTFVPEPGAEKILTSLGKTQILASSKMVLDLFGPPSWIGYSPTKRTEMSARIGWDLVPTPMIREQPEFFYGPLVDECSDVNEANGGYLGWCKRVKAAGSTVQGALDMGDETTYAHLARAQIRRAVVKVVDDIKQGNVVWVYGHGDMIPFVTNDLEAMPCPMPEASVVVCLVDRRKREILATAFANCPLND